MCRNLFLKNILSLIFTDEHSSVGQSNGRTECFSALGIMLYVVSTLRGISRA
jgi:hypothetical protein